MTRASRIRASTERASDELLDLEEACFVKLDAAVARVANAVQERVGVAAKASRLAVLHADLLPTEAWLNGVLLPPVGDLLAATRQRALVLVRQQLGELAANDTERDAAATGVTAAQDAATGIEREAYVDVAERLLRARVAVVSRLDEQRRLWQLRDEEPSALVARLCARDRVALPGTHARGAVWLLEAPMRGSARSASVLCTNRLVSAGIAGWNDARG